MVLSNLLAMPNDMKLFKCIQSRITSTQQLHSLTQNQLMNFSHHTFFCPGTLFHSKHNIHLF